MNGHFGCSLLSPTDQDISELDDTPANLLVSIRRAGVAVISSELWNEGDHEQRNGHEKFTESFILANFPILPKNLDHGV